jgi:hypothetical protein
MEQRNTVVLDDETMRLYTKLRNNLEALNRPDLPLSDLVNGVLKQELAKLISKNVHPHETLGYLNVKHLRQPEVGDNWHERFVQYFVVVAVEGPDDIVVAAYARLDGRDPGAYRVNRAWIARQVLYARTDKGGDLGERAFGADHCFSKPGDLLHLKEWYSQLDKTSIVDIRNEVPA